MISKVGFGFIPGTYKKPSGEDVPFLYTVGMAAHGLPEIVISGLPHELAGQSLQDTATLLLQGEIRTNVADDRFLQELDVYFVPVPSEKAALLLEIATARAGAPVDAIQIVWPDAFNKFPWDADCTEKIRSMQVMLFAEDPADATTALQPVSTNAEGDTVQRTTPRQRHTPPLDMIERALFGLDARQMH
jgi:hypothetical protein